MNRNDKQAIINQLRKHQAAIGKERDALREMQDEIQALFESCDRGKELLDDAISALSELA